ncbi:MAG TPA: hypothetical protein VKE98_17235 [Gemmataceae bacterium]|nr:hypothetical protein [Gemmataceae bacterium]
MTWIGFLWADGRWCPQFTTRSSDLGTCSKRLGELARGAGIPATHQMMTGGHVPPIIPPERRMPATAPDLEGDDP